MGISIDQRSDATVCKLPAQDLSQPIALKSYPSVDPNDIPGLGNQHGMPHIHVGQGYAGYTYDLPIVSDGFGSCWAGLVYDRETTRTSLIHVDDFEAKPNQRLKFERYFSLPNDGKREAIIVCGSRSHGGEHSKKYFHSIGCENVRLIKADSCDRHWAIAYFPEFNRLDIITKPGGNGGLATQYTAFSSSVYEGASRLEQHRDQRHFHRVWQALQLTRFDKTLVKLNGHYTDENFEQLVTFAKAIEPSIASTNQVRELLLRNSYAYESNGMLVVPRFLHWPEEDVSEPYYKMKQTPSSRSIRIYDGEDMDEFITRLTSALRGEKTKYLDNNFLHLKSEEGEVLLHFGFKEITFHSIQEGDLDRQVVNTCALSSECIKGHFSYQTVMSSRDNHIPQYTIEDWSFLEKERKIIEEMLDRDKRENQNTNHRSRRRNGFY